MDKEQRRRAAVREFLVRPEEAGDAEEINYVVRVSGKEAELVRGQLHPWDNASGTGQDETWECWAMDTGTLRKLIEQAQLAIRQAEAFEKRCQAEDIKAEKAAYDAEIRRRL